MKAALCSLAVLLMCGAINAQAADSDGGYQSMFDGETLDGWVVAPASTRGAWVAKEGMIVGTGEITELVT